MRSCDGWWRRGGGAGGKGSRLVAPEPRLRAAVSRGRLVSLRTRGSKVAGAGTPADHFPAQAVSPRKRGSRVAGAGSAAARFPAQAVFRARRFPAQAGIHYRRRRHRRPGGSLPRASGDPGHRAPDPGPPPSRGNGPSCAMDAAPEHPPSRPHPSYFSCPPEGRTSRISRLLVSCRASTAWSSPGTPATRARGSGGAPRFPPHVPPPRAGEGRQRGGRWRRRAI